MSQAIDTHALELAKELRERTVQYENGLICAAEFLNEVLLLADKHHAAAQDSTCSNRIAHCDTYECPAVKTPGSEEDTAKHEQFLKDYDSTTNGGNNEEA